ETFLLHARGVNDVSTAQPFFEGMGLLDDMAIASGLFQQGLRHFQPFGRYQGELKTAVECQQLDERMHRATVLQVANQSDMRTVEQLAQAGELREDGVEVQERLAGVLSGAVTAVHHRDISRTRELRD